jgi:hypothetical protein
MKKSDDWMQYALNLPMAHIPGEFFHYCNGVSHLLSAIIQGSTDMGTIDFAKKNLSTLLAKICIFQVRC